MRVDGRREDAKVRSFRESLRVKMRRKRDESCVGRKNMRRGVKGEACVSCVGENLGEKNGKVLFLLLSELLMRLYEQVRKLLSWPNLQELEGLQSSLFVRDLLTEVPRRYSLTRYAAVTGANKGIGFEIVRQLASNGVTVVLTASSEVRGTEATAKLHHLGFSNILFHRLDVLDQSSIDSLADFISQKFGRLDILEEVRNAERAIKLMGASVLQLCSGMLIIFSFELSLWPYGNALHNRDLMWGQEFGHGLWTMDYSRISPFSAVIAERVLECHVNDFRAMMISLYDPIVEGLGLALDLHLGSFVSTSEREAWLHGKPKDSHSAANLPSFEDVHKSEPARSL
ncbi:Short-chain dehydrogenase/reductase SDR [Corchorus olitorius]|uniref:Short-chain dehydrogenase/reductase SDR n=1 Tax=Corchorus olitorius TaxID=93759 RepID=A0A1R3HEZ7_9ROSI|nr:Short-chain dehydrogenase/reductase SDR [Corchorus olitorius]